jgi:hypothetical protein
MDIGILLLQNQLASYRIFESILGFFKLAMLWLQGTNLTWSLYRVGSLMTLSRELSKYKLDLVGVQEVRWV